MKAIAQSILFGVVLLFAVAVKPGETPKMASKWDFEGDPPDQAPAGFNFGRTGSGRNGRWVVKAEKDAPSGRNVLVQTDVDATSYRFPVAVADSVTVRNLRLSVRCKAVSGKVDQACGLVFRYRDENNYYVVRSNALENNVRLYYVKDGKRQQLAGWDGTVKRSAWHSLAVEARDDVFEIYWNREKVIDARDQTFKDAGKVGLWTKADSLTHFDDLLVEALNGG